MGLLPSYFASNNMPSLNVSQLQNRITRITLEQMYDYKIDCNTLDNSFKKNCYKLWNSLPIAVKMLPYSNKNNAFKEFNKVLISTKTSSS